MPVNKAVSPAARGAHALMCALVAAYGAMLLALSLRRTLPWGACLAAAAALFALLLACSRRLSARGPVLRDAPAARAPRAFWLSAGLCMAVMLAYLAAFYPGGYSSDTAMQLGQVSGAVFDDRHPALHSLMMLALWRICPHPVFLLLVQMACFSLAVGRLASALARWGFPRVPSALAVGYICLSPGISNVMSFLWKDCAFAICALLLGACVIEVYASRGAWLARPAHGLELGALLALGSILRHNGPALTLPCIAWLMIAYPRQIMRLLGALLCFIALFVGIKGPLYGAFDVSTPQTGITETFGLPMAVLTHVYAEAPDSLDADIAAYMERIAPWQTFYDHDACGDWNEVKWYLGDFDVSDYTLAQVFAFALRAAAAEPQLALEALAGLWDMPLLPFGDAYWRLSPYVDPLAPVPERSGVPLLARALNALCRYAALPLTAWLFWRPGFWLLAVMLACCAFAARRPLGALTLPAMLICYDLATALMLSSPTDFRFFVSTPMLAPAALLALACRPGGGEAA